MTEVIQYTRQELLALRPTGTIPMDPAFVNLPEHVKTIIQGLATPVYHAPVVKRSDKKNGKNAKATGAAAAATGAAVSSTPLNPAAASFSSHMTESERNQLQALRDAFTARQQMFRGQPAPPTTAAATTTPTAAATAATTEKPKSAFPPESLQQNKQAAAVTTTTTTTTTTTAVATTSAPKKTGWGAMAPRPATELDVKPLSRAERKKMENEGNKEQNRRGRGRSAGRGRGGRGGYSRSRSNQRQSRQASPHLSTTYVDADGNRRPVPANPFDEIDQNGVPPIGSDMWYVWWCQQAQEYPEYYPVPVEVPVDEHGQPVQVPEEFFRSPDEVRMNKYGCPPHSTLSFNVPYPFPYPQYNVGYHQHHHVPPAVLTTEAWERRLEQRNRQLRLGERTLGYRVYLKLRELKERIPPECVPPPLQQTCSKRSWDGQVRRWRNGLHTLDHLAEKYLSEEERAAYPIYGPLDADHNKNKEEVENGEATAKDDNNNNNNGNDNDNGN